MNKFCFVDMCAFCVLFECFWGAFCVLCTECRKIETHTGPCTDTNTVPQWVNRLLPMRKKSRTIVRFLCQKNSLYDIAVVMGRFPAYFRQSARSRSPSHIPPNLISHPLTPHFPPVPSNNYRTWSTLPLFCLIPREKIYNQYRTIKNNASKFFLLTNL